MANPHESHDGEHEHVGHVVPLKLLYGILFALILLTALTVYTATQVDFGFLNIWIAMGIATVKATLVVLFFMHMFWDRPFNQILFVATLVFLGLFISLALLDTRAYRYNLDKGDGTAVTSPASG